MHMSHSFITDDALAGYFVWHNSIYTPGLRLLRWQVNLLTVLGEYSARSNWRHHCPARYLSSRQTSAGHILLVMCQCHIPHRLTTWDCSQRCVVPSSVLPLFLPLLMTSTDAAAGGLTDSSAMCASLTPPPPPPPSDYTLSCPSGDGPNVTTSSSRTSPLTSDSAKRSMQSSSL